MHSGKHDACTGDSGGPLTCIRDGQPYLVGVITRGSGCGDAGSPTLYADIYHYLDWINSVARDWCLEKKPHLCGEIFPWKDGYFVNGTFVD